MAWPERSRPTSQSGTIVQGGSTITQQVAKSFLSDQERTLDRKVREAILSLRMESSLGKRAILEIYLNKIFLGHGAYGVRAAASAYFDKDLDELSLAEAAMIAGLAQAPSRWSPVSNPDFALRRRDEVLGDMVEAGYLTEAEAAEAKAEPIVLAETRDPFRWRAPFYAEHVRQVVEQQLGADAVLTDGLDHRERRQPRGRGQREPGPRRLDPQARSPARLARPGRQPPARVGA